MTHPTAEAVRPSISDLDSRLLASALREMIRRFTYCAKEAGYTDRFIATCTDSEIALLNRVELGLELTGESK